MQSYKDIQATDIIRDSREVINDNIKTAISNNSGEAFPTDNLITGMKCYRTDEGKTYTYNGTEWVADDSKADNATHATTADTCTGNSATATTLETGRNISLTGAATGTATAFDGSSDIAIPVTSLDASKLTGTASVSTTGNSATTTKLATARTLTITDGTNSGTATSFDGSANVSIKLPSTIKASLSGNATTASTLATGRTIALSGGATGTATSFNGGSNITIPVTALDASKITSNLNSIVTNLLGDSAGSHNSFFRGKSLGTSFTTSQSNAIKAGTFDDMFIGDYWTINNVVYRIAHFDYWYNCGDTACTTHHALIVPDNQLYTAQMNTTNTTAGGYVGSAMYTTNLATAKSTITSAFGSGHILSHREYLVNAVSNGKPSGGAWVDSTVELMSENMVYGSKIFSPPGCTDGSTIIPNYTVAKGQLTLFMLAPRYQFTRSYWCWLRDVVSSACFAVVGSDGGAGYTGASDAGGVRPAFSIY